LVCDDGANAVMLLRCEWQSQAVSYSFCALVQCPDGGVERLDFVADVVGECRDSFSEDDPGEG